MAPEVGAANGATSVPVVQDTSNIFELLQTLPSSSLNRLYGQDAQNAFTANKLRELANGDKGALSSPSISSTTGNPHPWTCRAVYQSLPALAKQYVMRLLALESPVNKNAIADWVNPQFFEAHNRALQKLDKLRILQSADNEGIRLALNSHFRANLRAALTTHRSDPWTDPCFNLRPSSHPLTSTQLESYMYGKWNGVLHYLVGCTAAGFDEPADEVLVFLIDTGLMGEPEDEEGGSRKLMDIRELTRKRGQLRITNAGVEFLLKDVHVQVWRFVQFIISHQASSRDEILTFLFQLSYCRVGRYYPVAALTPFQQELLSKFASFGLIYRRSSSSSRFYPTGVAVNLIFGAAAISRQQGGTVPKELKLVDPNQLAIIVETNYQIVAYTQSSLHVEMLRIFADVRCRLPNVVIAFITRSSVRRAMASGISARTILSFIKAHVHPAVQAKKARLLPENVEAQIELWHREKGRVKYTECVLMDFGREDLGTYKEAREYAQHLGVLAWAPEQTKEVGRLLAIRPEGVERVRDLVEERRSPLR